MMRAIRTSLTYRDYNYPLLIMMSEYVDSSIVGGDTGTILERILAVPSVVMDMPILAQYPNRLVEARRSRRITGRSAELPRSLLGFPHCTGVRSLLLRYGSDGRLFPAFPPQRLRWAGLTGLGPC
jgi:hypothetical protein